MELQTADEELKQERRKSESNKSIISDTPARTCKGTSGHP